MIYIYIYIGKCRRSNAYNCTHFGCYIPIFSVHINDQIIGYRSEQVKESIAFGEVSGAIGNNN